MKQLYTILLWVFFVYLCDLSVFSAQAQTVSPVLLEAPKPLGDIRSLRREKDIETFKPVAERTPSELDAVPVRWRGFVILPNLVSEQAIDTNIFATSKDQETDTITSLKPSVSIGKNFGRHRANASIGGELKKYWSNTGEDIFNFDAKIGGTLEARRELTIPFELTYASGHEGRGQNFSPNFSEEPIGFKTYGGALGINYNPNRFNLSLVGRYGNIAFDNGSSNAGNIIIREDGDRSFTDLEMSASYEILPNHRPFVSLNIGSIDYERGDFQNGSFSGPERDSVNLEALTGWQFSYKGLVQGSFGLGYGSRDYDDDSIDDVASTRVASNLSWNVTKKATLNLGLKRSITEDNQIVQGVLLSQAKVSLDYEFLHNLYYNTYLDYALAEFEGSSREDDILSAGAGLRYLINPRYSLSGDYKFKSRDSSAMGLDYDRHQFMMRFHSRF